MKTAPVGEYGLQLNTFGFINCYLVREPDGFTLIDALLPSSADWICAIATEREIPIRRVVLTHAHPDHIGAVDFIMDHILDVELAATQSTLSCLKQTPGRNTQVLTPGERYGSLLVIDTPGHLPGHISLLDERDESLYAGDAVVALGAPRGGLLIAGHATGWTRFSNLFNNDKPVALASARHLLSYPIQRFATGHGPIREGGPGLLENAIASAK